MSSMELVHALNRGVDKRDIFLEEIDYIRFVHNLYAFNDSSPADTNTGYHFRTRDIVSPYIETRRERVVDVHGWCLMKNHYHLLLSERQEGGLSLFLRKVNVGYAKYFNEKYGRTGTLFQGRTKKVPIEREAHFNYILHYIHLNPLDYLEGAQKWRIRSKAGIADTGAALDYLSGYRWSSYLDYAGVKNFPSLLTTSLFQNEDMDYASSLHEFLQSTEEDSPTLSLE